MELARAVPALVLRTAETIARARRLLAYGGLDGVASRPLEDGEGGAFPQLAAGARGCELVDTTGRTFVDWVNGWGPVILGYRRPEVEAAIVAQLQAGPTLSLMHAVEIEVAERIARLVPCAEQVAFGKNGSDVVTAAVRIARAVTGRDAILQYGFHGFHDWYACLLPGVRGIPATLRELVRPFPYGDLASLDALLARGDVAAVVMEPVREIEPAPGYLAGVRELCTRHGALLVFDEIVTAFRVAKGGAQELYGVLPDLACLGKSMANGMPLSALVGKRELMRHLPSVGVGMTFRGETLSLAAARATLDVIEREDVPRQLARTGERVRARFAELAARHRVRAKLTGPPARLTFVFQDDRGLGWEEQRTLFLQECLQRGVLSNGNLLASSAHDDAAVDRTLAGFDGALARVAEALHTGVAADGTRLGPRALAARGFAEALVETPESLHVAGWLLLADGAADELVARGPRGGEIACVRVERADLARAFPDVLHAGEAGFAVTVPAAAFADERRWDVLLVAKRGARVAFACRVLRRRAADAPGGPHDLADGVVCV